MRLCLAAPLTFCNCLSSSLLRAEEEIHMKSTDFNLLNTRVAKRERT
jgi:hypothetical protein